MSMTHMSSDRVRVITLLKKSNGPDLLCVHISVSPSKVPNYFSPLGFFFPTFPPALNHHHAFDSFHPSKPTAGDSLRFY